MTPINMELKRIMISDEIFILYYCWSDVKEFFYFNRSNRRSLQIYTSSFITLIHIIIALYSSPHFDLLIISWMLLELLTIYYIFTEHRSFTHKCKMFSRRMFHLINKCRKYVFYSQMLNVNASMKVSLVVNFTDFHEISAYIKQFLPVSDK